MATQGPAAESLRISEHYRQLSDGELTDLAQHPSELTEMALTALQQEISSRRLKVPPVEEQRETNWAPPHNDDSDESPYAEERKLVRLTTVWSRRDAEQLQGILVQAGIPFCIGPEKATNVDEVRSSFSDGLGVQVMKAAFPYVQSWLGRYEPEDEPPGEKMDDDPDLAVHCPRCHSADVVFEHLAEAQGSEEEDDSEETDADEVETESATAARKFDWTCAACGYKWEDDGVESK
ncbi:MAG TPA: hypothetical protein VN682_04055 [Terriglobales bacterium]|nr:hypothetical protein [Terriglobales bacterium]